MPEEGVSSEARHKIMRAVSKLLFKSAEEGLFNQLKRFHIRMRKDACSQKGAKHACRLCRDAFVSGSRAGVSGARFTYLKPKTGAPPSHFSHCDRISSQDPTSRHSGQLGVPGEVV